MPSVRPMLELHLGTSRGLTGVLGLSYGVAALGIAWSGPLWLACGALPVLGWDCWRVLAQHGLCRAPGAVRHLVQEPSGDWVLTTVSGTSRTCAPVPGASFCHPLLVMLALRDGRRRRYVLVARDAVAAGPFRELRVSLRAAV